MAEFDQIDQGLQQFGIDPAEIARRLAQRQAPPGMPPAAPSSPQPTVPAAAGRMATPPGAAPAASPALGQSAPLPSTAPAMPAQTRAQTGRAAGPPQLHGWKNVLDIIGQIAAPNIEERIPGTPGHYVAAQQGLDKEATTELNQEDTRSQIADRERTANLPMAAEKANWEKLGPGEEVVNPATGERIAGPPAKAAATPRAENLEQEYSDAVADAQARGVDPATDPKVQQIAAAAKAYRPEPRASEPNLNDEEAKAVDELVAKGVPRIDAIAQVKRNAAPVNTSGLGMMAVARIIEEASRLNPELGKLLPGILAKEGIQIPAGANITGTPLGQPLSPETGQPIGTAMPGAPTVQTRNQAQMGSKVLAEMPATKQMVKDLSGYLGPVQGRANVAFLLGKVGSTGDAQKDRQLSALRTNLTMMSSAAAKFHLNSVRAMEEFEKDADSGKDSAPALNGFLDQIQEWAQTAQKPERGYGETAPATGGGTGQNNVIRYDAQGNRVQ